jgi:hypothetical protein
MKEQDSETETMTDCSKDLNEKNLHYKNLFFHMKIGNYLVKNQIILIQIYPKVDKF